MTTPEEWRFRAYTLNQAASRLRNSAARLIEDARDYENLAASSSRMAEAPQSPQEAAEPSISKE